MPQAVAESQREAVGWRPVKPPTWRNRSEGVSTMHTTTVKPELLDQANLFRQRADSLRSQADTLDPWLAATYRRRASELELEAFVSEVQSGIPYDEVHLPA
jgi:hypothetical protein